jgi:Fic family protein
VVYRRLEGALDDLQRLGGLPSPREAETIWSDIWHLEAHHSTALEGNTLVLREVESLLDRGLAVGAKPLAEYMEVKGYGDAADWVYAQGREPGDWSSGDMITLAEIRHTHELVMTPVWSVSPHEQASNRESPGQFREHDINPFPGGMTPPSWPLVPSMLADWLAYVAAATPVLRGEESQEHLPEVLARLHNGFERVHPFLDGNGRTGRLVLNLILVRANMPPVIILKRQRDSYLAALRRADVGEFGPLAELLARAMTDNLNRFIVPNVAGPSREVPLAGLVRPELSLAALRQAAQRGRLRAWQGSDGVWRSTRRAVDDYQRTKGRRRSPTAD